MKGFLKGPAKIIPKEELENKTFTRYDGYFVQIMIHKVNNHLHFPYLSKISSEDEEGITINSRNWTNDMEGEKIIVDRFTLETIMLHHDIEYTALKGLYFNEGRNNKICEIIEFLFNKRKEYKQVKNPIQNLYKLMMNSAYGKTIERAHSEKIKYFNHNKSMCLSRLHREYNGMINEIIFFKGKWKMKYTEGIGEHYNRAHCGSEVLGKSKQLMSNVMVDVDKYIYYTDSDSMFIEHKGVDILRRTKPEIFGENLGQFHNDFSLGGTNVRAERAVFFGKKSYWIEVKNDEGDVLNKFVLKGIPKNTIEYVLEHKFKNNIDHVIKALRFRKSGVVFDLTLNGNKIKMQHNFNHEIYNAVDFARSIGPFY